MRRTPMKRTAFKRNAHLPPPGTEARLREELERTGRMAQLLTSAVTRQARSSTYSGTTAGPHPKQPADRNQAVRDLAMGEECQVRYAPVCRGRGITEYTIWAHSNSGADGKGMGYKASDSAGAFSCDRCHLAIDVDRKILPVIELEEVWRGARERTLIRLRAIASSYTERPWRVRAAKWALERNEITNLKGQS